MKRHRAILTAVQAAQSAGRVTYQPPEADPIPTMDRLTDDDLIELLGTLGVLRLEVQELRALAQTMVPKDELGTRWRRLRLAGFITVIVMLIVFIPFGFVLNEARSSANSAKHSNQALIQDQYDRAKAGQQQCADRNNTQLAIVLLIGKLLDAEQHAQSPAQERIDAYSGALHGAGKLSDCSAFVKQQQDLIRQGANPKL